MANEYTLAASAARTTAGTTNGTSTFVGGFVKRAIVVLDITAVGTGAGDKLDVMIDVSPDGSKWLNAAHFAQMLGTGAAKTEFAILDPTNPGTATIVSTTDAAVSTVRPGAWGKWMRARWTIVDAGGGVQTFTFSAKVYTQ
jgi:hypothetical protein